MELVLDGPGSPGLLTCLSLIFCVGRDGLDGYIMKERLWHRVLACFPPHGRL